MGRVFTRMAFRRTGMGPISPGERAALAPIWWLLAAFVATALYVVLSGLSAGPTCGPYRGQTACAWKNGAPPLPEPAVWRRWPHQPR
jgi:hypothetical protein